MLENSCGTVALNGPFFCFFLADHRATDFTLSKICGTETKNSSHLSTVIFTTKFFVDNSLRYIFIYRFSYLLTYYYSFLVHYNKKCFDINWFYLLSPAILSLWYSCFEVTWHLGDDSNSKTRVRYVYILPEVLHGDFLSEIKYLFNLEGNILHILTRNDYSNWGELSFTILKFFM